MDFGLRVEPEMVSPDSALARAHPEWVLGGDTGPPGARCRRRRRRQRGLRPGHAAGHGVRGSRADPFRRTRPGWSLPGASTSRSVRRRGWCRTRRRPGCVRAR
ncbi:alpha-galactosidase [Actinoplanes sp. NPDC049118]|uniref:alpha-galactosidase n=1 Tax=Actinoplanes sp. NPDC049118 TaxID=3155769 RepID=UPI00340C6C13